MLLPSALSKIIIRWQNLPHEFTPNVCETQNAKLKIKALGKFLRYNHKTFRDFAILGLVFVLPFFHRFANVALELIFLISIIEIIRTKRFPEIRMHWFLPVLFVYYLLSELLWGGEIATLEKRVFFVLSPLAMALNPEFGEPNLQRKIFKSYILGNMLAVVTCAIRATTRSITFDSGAWLFNAKVIRDSNYDFFTSSVMGGNYFFSSEFSLFHHPTYASIYIVFAQYLIFEVYLGSSRINKIVLIATSAIFFVAIFLLSSKAAILSFLLMFFWLLFRFRISSTIRITAIAVLALICVIFFFFNPRMKVFKDSFQTSRLINPDARYGHDLRILSWEASATIIKDNWLIGVGEPNKEVKLVEVYKQKRYVVPGEAKHNSHNQYLDFIIGGGVIGFGIFVAGILSLIINSIRKSNFPLQAFLVIFCFNALFENILSRHDGILFFSVFVGLLILRRGMPDDSLKIEED